MVNLNTVFKSMLKLKESVTMADVSGSTGIPDEQIVDWTDLGREMWSFLTGRDAAINYRFIEMAVQVPRDTGADAPRATWRFDGTLHRREIELRNLRFESLWRDAVDGA